jgi:hypothetical protein
MKPEDALILRELEKDIGKYPYVPIELVKYLTCVIEKEIKEGLQPALLGPNRKNVLEDINEMFMLACKTCNMNLAEFIHALEFKTHDVGEARLDAFFAVVRVINWLRIAGFKNIKPLKTRKTKSADVICNFNNLTCAVEVFCSPGTYFRYPGHETKSMNLAYYYISRAREKREQLDITATEFSCKKKILALVFNSFSAQATLTRDDFIEMLKETAQTLDWGDDYHYVLITGMRDTISGISDKTMFPPIL